MKCKSEETRGRSQGESPFPLDFYLSWMSTKPLSLQCPFASAFPDRIGSAAALVFSRPAQRLLRYGLHTRQVASSTVCREASESRCLHCCSDCYRMKRTSSRAGLPAVDHHLFTAHPVTRLSGKLYRRFRTNFSPRRIISADHDAGSRHKTWALRIQYPLGAGGMGRSIARAICVLNAVLRLKFFRHVTLSMPLFAHASNTKRNPSRHCNIRTSACCTILDRKVAWISW